MGRMGMIAVVILGLEGYSFYGISPVIFLAFCLGVGSERCVSMRAKVVPLVVLVLLYPVFLQTAWSAEEDIVEYRKDNMNLVKGHMGSLVALVKGKVSYTDHIPMHAAGLAQAARMGPQAFKDKAMAGKTTAKGTIWSEADKFDEAMDNFIMHATALEKASLSQDRAAIQVALGQVGKSCKTCHDAFREKK